MKEYDEEEHLKKWKSWLGLAGLIYAVILIIVGIINYVLKLNLNAQVIVIITALITFALLVTVKYTSKSKEATHYKKMAQNFENELKDYENGKKKTK